VTPEALTAAFAARFGGRPAGVARAPGRVNLIGEHTDYNDGFVLPMAIDRDVRIAFRPRPDARVVAHSVAFGETVELALDTGAPPRARRGRHGWGEYVAGVAWALRAAGHAVTGWDGVVSGDVPIGAGLSSSAALEVAAARVFAAVGGLRWEPAAMARAAQRAENEWIGMRCGIMDQLASAAARAGHALLLDCRSLETQQVPLPPEAAVVVLDTGTRRGLVDSEYNARRRECEAAARLLGVPALRDATPSILAGARWPDEPTLLRARHVVTENARTVAAARALEAGDLARVGALMAESHASLRDDFGVSTDALDAMVRAAGSAPGVIGARLTGAGFGGCVVALVEAARADAFAAAAASAYRRATGREPSVHAVRAAAGAEVLA
jgi:galactokinase